MLHAQNVFGRNHSFVITDAVRFHLIAFNMHVICTFHLHYISNTSTLILARAFLIVCFECVYIMGFVDICCTLNVEMPLVRLSLTHSPRELFIIGFYLCHFEYFITLFMHVIFLPFMYIYPELKLAIELCIVWESCVFFAVIFSCVSHFYCSQTKLTMPIFVVDVWFVCVLVFFCTIVNSWLVPNNYNPLSCHLFSPSLWKLAKVNKNKINCPPFGALQCTLHIHLHFFCHTLICHWAFVFDYNFFNSNR